MTHVGKIAPSWISEDKARGWSGASGGAGLTAHLTVIRAGVNEDDPNAVKLAYVYKDRLHLSEILPAGSEYKDKLYQLLNDLVVPVTAVCAYKGTDLLEEIPVRMRGS